MISDDDQSKADRDRRNWNTALDHANKIQRQKDVQPQILDAIVHLIDGPQNEPSLQAAAQKFASLISVFQPSDFDDLIEERQIEDRCGYALCPHKLRDAASTPRWNRSADTAKFCSPACASSASYVKAQLSPIPAWERPVGGHPVIALRELGTSRDSSQVLSVLQTQSAKHGQDLALERGELTDSLLPMQVMTDNVVERPIVLHKPISSLEKAMVSSTAIEGYEPRGKTKPSGYGGRDDDEDDNDSSET